jgi:hypothetical protein
MRFDTADSVRLSCLAISTVGLPAALSLKRRRSSLAVHFHHPVLHTQARKR